MSPSPSNQSWFSWMEAATLAQSYQSPWPTLSQEGVKQAAVPPEAAVTAAIATVEAVAVSAVAVELKIHAQVGRHGGGYTSAGAL